MGMNSHSIFLSNFKVNMDTNLDIVKYERRMNTSDLDIYSISKIIFSYFLLLVLKYKIIIHVQTKV